MDNTSSLTKEPKDMKEGRPRDVKHVEKVFQRQQVMLMDPYVDPAVDATEWHVSGVSSPNHNFVLFFFVFFLFLSRVSTHVKTAVKKDLILIKSLA